MNTRSKVMLMAACAAFVALPMAGHAQSSCAEQMPAVEAKVAAMHHAGLKARAEKAIAAAKANAASKQERRCLDHLKAAQRAVRKDTVKAGKPHD